MVRPTDPIAGEEIGLHVPGPLQPESRWGHNEYCDHPEWWHATDGDSTEVEVSDLAWGLVRALQPRVCVETGSGWGQTTMAIARALKANEHGWLYTLEIDERRVDHVSELTADYPVSVVAMPSLDWAPTDSQRGQIDFAWLDSICGYRVPEFEMLEAWLSPQAVVCFHDTRPGHCTWGISSGRDLRSEIEAVLGDRLTIMHLPTPRGVTVAQRR